MNFKIEELTQIPIVVQNCKLFFKVYYFIDIRVKGHWATISIFVFLSSTPSDMILNSVCVWCGGGGCKKTYNFTTCNI